jgi:hypothetical protein
LPAPRVVVTRRSLRMQLRQIVYWATGDRVDEDEARMRFVRGAFWTFVTIGTTAILLGVVAIGKMFGLAAMGVAVFLLFLLCVRLERRQRA